MTDSDNVVFDFFRVFRIMFLGCLRVTVSICNVGKTVGFARKAIGVSQSFVGDSRNRIYAVNQLRTNKITRFG